MPKPYLPEQNNKSIPLFWRHTELPFLEVRAVADGRTACYQQHIHHTFSIGAITAGTSNFFDGKNNHQTKQGTVVLINPDRVHACNPIDNQQWSYLMYYVDATWLTELQQEPAISNGCFYPFPETISDNPIIYQGLVKLYQILCHPEHELLYKQSAAVSFFSLLQQQITPSQIIEHSPLPHQKLQQVADYISAHCSSVHCSEALQLATLCELVELSPYYLIRSFKKYFGITPHDYLINRRIQYGQRLLKQGSSIIDAALASGFADQAHFQRTFKRLLSTTPKQYQA